MFKISILLSFLLLLTLSPGFCQTDNTAEQKPEKQGYDFSESVLGIRYAPGLVAYSKYFWLSFYMNSAELYFRLFNIAEASIGVLSQYNSLYGNSLFFFGNLRFSPRIGSYMPAIGTGLCINGINTMYYNINIDAGLFSVYFIVIPLRFDFRLPALYSIRWGLVFSVFEFKYGALISSGNTPSLHATGDFYFDMTLFSIGIQLYF